MPERPSLEGSAGIVPLYIPESAAARDNRFDVSLCCRQDLTLSAFAGWMPDLD